MQIKYGIIGGSGRMGQEIESLLEESGHKCVFKYDISGEWKSEDPEVMIDFSLPQAFASTLNYVNRYKIPLVIGTTGKSLLKDFNVSICAEDNPVVPITKGILYLLT